MTYSAENKPTIGTKVYFGRGNGERTLGTVVKTNPKKAKVRQDEARGVHKNHPVGTVWTVPYSLLTPAPQDAEGTTTPVETKPQTPKKTLDVFMHGEDHAILEAINSCYCALSPENLSCDGELPRAQVRRRASELNKKLKHLFLAFGREVDEIEVYNYLENRRKMFAKKD